MWPQLGDAVVTLDLDDPPVTIHVTFGSGVAPDDGNIAIDYRHLHRILEGDPSPEKFLTIIKQDLDDLDFE